MSKLGGNSQMERNMASDTAILTGVVAVYTDKSGNVIASATDFDGFHPAGFTVKQIQEMNVHRKLARLVVKAYSSDVLVEAISGTDICESILRKLINNGGKVSFVYIGHDIG
jgi:hypothetical protein